MKLSDKAIGLLEGKNFGFLATLGKGGYPHVTPVWVDYSDGFILINSTKDRIKVKKITEKGAKEHIDRLAFKYTGVRKFQGGNGKRVIMKIEAERVIESL